MKTKRLLSVLLALCMMLSIIPAMGITLNAYSDYSAGDTCPECGSGVLYWGEYSGWSGTTHYLFCTNEGCYYHTNCNDYWGCHRPGEGGDDCTVCNPVTEFTVDNILYRILNGDQDGYYDDNPAVGVADGTSVSGDVVIPDTVEYAGTEYIVYEILNSAFCRNDYNNKESGYTDTNITSVEIGDNVDKIGSYAFYGCTNLSSVSLGSSVRYIDSDAFAGTALTEVTLPESIKQVDGRAFATTNPIDVKFSAKINPKDPNVSISSAAFNLKTSDNSVDLKIVGYRNQKELSAENPFRVGQVLEPLFSGYTGSGEISFVYSVGYVNESSSYRPRVYNIGYNSTNKNFVETSKQGNIFTGYNYAAFSAQYEAAGYNNIKSLTCTAYEMEPENGYYSLRLLTTETVDMTSVKLVTDFAAAMKAEIEETGYIMSVGESFTIPTLFESGGITHLRNGCLECDNLSVVEGSDVISVNTNTNTITAAKSGWAKISVDVKVCVCMFHSTRQLETVTEIIPIYVIEAPTITKSATKITVEDNTTAPATSSYSLVSYGLTGTTEDDTTYFSSLCPNTTYDVLQSVSFTDGDATYTGARISSATTDNSAAVYNITNGTAEADKATNNGYITVAKKAVKDETVIVTVTPNDEYRLDKITVNGTAIDGTTFTMPASAVTVSATFRKIGVDLDKTSITLYEEQTETITATVTLDDDADKTVTWTSLDTTVATVSAGTVTAIKAGTTTITATAGGKSATCTVTVKAHTHTWTYSVDGAVFTAVCSGEGVCKSTATTLTLLAPANLTYTGAAKTATISATELGDKTVSADDIEYFVKGSSTAIAAPSETGTYEAKLTIDGKTAVVEYKINPASIKIKCSYPDTGFYGASHDDSPKTCVIAFSAQVEDIAVYKDFITGFGMYYYCEGKQDQPKTLECTSTTQIKNLLDNDGWFYGFVDGIEEEYFGKTVYCVPYIIIGKDEDKKILTESGFTMQAYVDGNTQYYLGKTSPVPVTVEEE